ncbi:MAG TPA: sigma-70 family RNA polymerase sigma factor, partial [Ilumatobacteraceae bacterium]|nr:sigma-70 family RNA polymerase sigma factor [Ilumatobacteraceae bacterium]
MGGEVQAAREDDRALLALVRDGDLDAYGELYARHSAAAHRFARSLLANRTDADDAVAEVFASLLATLQRGRGPTEQFLPYLLTSVRNECRRANRRGSRESVDRREQVTHLIDARRAHEDPAGDLAEGAVIATALTTLPPHLREILWRTEVEEEPARAIAAERGATPHAVAESALRARRALGSAYLQLHVGDGLPVDEADPECDAARPHLAAYVRRTVGLRRRRHIDRHLRTCPSCAAAHDALARVNRRLRARPLLPVDVGGLGMVSWGVKAQVLTWLSATAGPIAASGAVVIAVFAPTHHGGLDRVEAASQAPAEVVVTAPVPAGEDPDSRAAPAATTPDDVARPTVASRQASTAAAGADVPPEQPSTTAPAPVLAEPEPTLAPPPAPAGGPPPAVLAATDGAPDLGVPAPSAAAPSAP